MGDDEGGENSGWDAWQEEKGEHLDGNVGGEGKVETVDDAAAAVCALAWSKRTNRGYDLLNSRGSHKIGWDGRQ